MARCGRFVRKIIGHSDRVLSSPILALSLRTLSICHCLRQYVGSLPALQRKDPFFTKQQAHSTSFSTHEPYDHDPHCIDGILFVNNFAASKPLSFESTKPQSPAPGTPTGFPLLSLLAPSGVHTRTLCNALLMYSRITKASEICTRTTKHLLHRTSRRTPLRLRLSVRGPFIPMVLDTPLPLRRSRTLADPA